MGVKESIRYFITDIILDILAVSFLLFLGWHFWQEYIVVAEPRFWVLCIEMFGLVPLIILFGLYKLIEDIILYQSRLRSGWYIFTESGLEILFLASMGFIEYNFAQIFVHGKSQIATEHPWWILSPILFWSLIGLYKAWEDFRDIGRIGA